MNVGIRASILAFLLSLLPITGTAIAQTMPDPALLTPNTVTGVQPFGIYDGVRGHINLSNGNVNFYLPLIKLPQRAGRNFELGVELDSKTWALRFDFFGPQWYASQWYQNTRVPMIAPNMRLSVPTLETSGGISTTAPFCRMNWTFTSPDGSKHVFANLCVNPTDKTRDSGDGSFMRIDISNTSDIVVRMKDGTAVHFFGFTNNQWGGGYPLQPFDTIVDTNGNVVSSTKVNGVLTSITDTAGRQVGIDLTNHKISYKDANGTPQQIILASVTPLTPGGSITLVHPLEGECSLPYQTDSVSQMTGTGNTAWTMTLPNGASGLTYRFDFDAAGEIIRVGSRRAALRTPRIGALAHSRMIPSPVSSRLQTRSRAPRLLFTMPTEISRQRQLPLRTRLAPPLSLSLTAMTPSIALPAKPTPLSPAPCPVRSPPTSTTKRPSTALPSLTAPAAAPA